MITGPNAPDSQRRVPGWPARVSLLFVFFFAVQRLLAAGALRFRPQAIPGRDVILQALFALIAAGVTATVALVILRRAPTSSSAEAATDHERFLAAAESTLDDFYIFDGITDEAGDVIDFRFSYINPSAERRLNVRREDLLGKVLTEVRPHMISSGLIAHYREVARSGISYITEVFVDDHMVRATWLSLQVVKLGGGIAITSRDITERKRLDDQVTYLAHYDQLTGLPNRTLLQDRLHQAILRADRYHQKIAVFLFDIDRFKSINDTRGHSEGDAVLAALGKHLLSAMRSSDTIARMGGDEFIILMQDFRSLEDVTRCGLDIVERAAMPLRLKDHEISITISVGLCIYPDCGPDPDRLLKNADLAMYAAKKAGGNGLRIFSEPSITEPSATLASSNGLPA